MMRNTDNDNLGYSRNDNNNHDDPESTIVFGSVIKN